MKQVTPGCNQSNQPTKPQYHKSQRGDNKAAYNYKHSQATKDNKAAALVSHKKAAPDITSLSKEQKTITTKQKKPKNPDM